MFTDRRTVSILGAVVVCTLPHLVNVSLWVGAVCLFMWLYTFAAALFTWRLPNRLTMGLLAAIFFAAALSTHDGLTLEAFVALLALMVNMKLLEVRAGRDRVITVILCYFLIVAALFFGDSIGATMYLLFAILYTTAVLIYINHPRHGAVLPAKLSATIMLQALPVALVLFLLFPRIEGGLWGRARINSARTGFSDTMSFGNIAELASNPEVAFRVEFADQVPPREQLYWRGIVLWEFDGTAWRRGIHRRSSSLRPPGTSQRVRYTVILEPHNEHWLLTLDLPVQINFHRAWLNSDHTCYRWWPITQRISYSGTSDIGINARRDEQLFNEALVLPAQGNPRARELAKRLAVETEDTSAYVAKILGYFRQQPFTYTLKPPPLITVADRPGEDPAIDLVDRFLFESRKGFCEHFAGSFAFLMRAAGIPARVVVGYQGGDLNRYGGYLAVRQSDAHAWCEVWIAGKGWVRVDPTAVVAPARLTGNTAGALPPGETAGLLFSIRSGPFGAWLGTTLNVLDFLNSKWNRWVMDYSPYNDLDFMVRLGIDFESRRGWGQALLIVLTAAAAVAALVIVLFLSGQRGKAKDEVALAWSVYCRKLAAAGFPRRPGQGPVDYMEQVVQRRPELADRIRKITASYVQLRYRRQSNPDEARAMRKMVEKFSPRKSGK